MILSGYQVQVSSVDNTRYYQQMSRPWWQGNFSPREVETPKSAVDGE